ncbi:MAG: OmpA family protein [Gammaproteobacteria bacterium]|nr:OmpA family protein [Gammaproteobacteria bacterium]
MPDDKGERIFMICANCPAPTVKTPISRSIAMIEAIEKTTPIVNIRPTRDSDPQPQVLHIAHFAFGTALPSASEKQALRDLLPRLEHQRLVLTGYTDSAGPQDFNEWLALRRAQYLKEYLVAIGLEGDAIEVSGQGQCCYLQSNDTDAGRSANRRTELRISSLPFSTLHPDPSPSSQPKGELP